MPALHLGVAFWRTLNTRLGPTEGISDRHGRFANRPYTALFAARPYQPGFSGLLFAARRAHNARVATTIAVIVPARTG